MKLIHSNVLFISFSSIVISSLPSCSCGEEGEKGNVGDPCTYTQDCLPGLVCAEGTCREPVQCPSGTTACGAECCSSGQTCLGEHCCPDGSVCGSECCSASEVCEAGVCTACPQPLCGGVCCGEGEVCNAGACCDEDKVCASLCCGPDEICDEDQCWLDCGENERCTDADGSGVCCGDGQICYSSQCTTPGDACTFNENCPDGFYCETTIGRCLPVLPGSEDCVYHPPVDPFTPALQCSYTAPPPGDPNPDSVHVVAPIVVDFDLDDDPDTLSPSIVFISHVSWAGPGILRIIDGRDCSLQFSLNGSAEDYVLSVSTPAAGDIDGDTDGRAEIVVPAHGGGLLAFKYDAGSRKFERLWRSAVCATDGTRTPDATGPWNGPGVSIHDLDDDGTPEVVYSGTLYDAEGCLRGATPGYLSFQSIGTASVVADVDEDGAPELVTGSGIYAYDAAAKDFFMEDYFAGAGLAQGRVAVADMADRPLASLDVASPPEVVVISTGTVRVQTIEGTVIFGPVAQPGGGNGGEPTVADFDGDTLREFACAGTNSYTVYDPDCTAAPEGRAGGECPSGRTDGILWSQASQDFSSNFTGSSVFDFEGDGKAEAVYSDECFTRVYDGVTGEVIWSVSSESGTATENPVIADVDGDFHTEIVVGINNYFTDGCPSLDPLYIGGGCADSEDCGGFGLSCIGSLCRSEFRGNEDGIFVYCDGEDRWVNSRPVWNQHAYYVTNVNDDGTIPASGDAERNWEIADLNNFRQNILREGIWNAPDLVAIDPAAGIDGCPARYTLMARILNQGSSGVAAGVPVGFYVVDEEGMETFAGAAATARPLMPGMSEKVTLEWDVPAEMGDLANFDFYAVADDATAGAEAAPHECIEDNNRSGLCSVHCLGVL